MDHSTRDIEWVSVVLLVVTLLFSCAGLYLNPVCAKKAIFWQSDNYYAMLKTTLLVEDQVKVVVEQDLNQR